MVSAGSSPTTNYRWHVVHDPESRPRSQMAVEEGGGSEPTWEVEWDLPGQHRVYCRVMQLREGRRVGPICHVELLGNTDYQVLGADEPIERLAYVFIEERRARAHLHELWLREIECWTFIEGREVRIDDSYTPPPPEKPAWVEAVEARERA